MDILRQIAGDGAAAGRRADAATARPVDRGGADREEFASFLRRPAAGEAPTAERLAKRATETPSSTPPGTKPVEGEAGETTSDGTMLVDATSAPTPTKTAPAETTPAETAPAETAPERRASTAVASSEPEAASDGWSDAMFVRAPLAGTRIGDAASPAAAAAIADAGRAPRGSTASASTGQDAPASPAASRTDAAGPGALAEVRSTAAGSEPGRGGVTLPSAPSDRFAARAAIPPASSGDPVVQPSTTPAPVAPDSADAVTRPTVGAAPDSRVVAGRTAAPAADGSVQTRGGDPFADADAAGPAPAAAPTRPPIDAATAQALQQQGPRGRTESPREARAASAPPDGAQLASSDIRANATATTAASGPILAAAYRSTASAKTAAVSVVDAISRDAASAVGVQESADLGGLSVSALQRSDAAAVPLQSFPQTASPAQLRAVAEAVASARDGDRVEIRLDPPELGRVAIDIRIEDGAVTAQIDADRPETLDLLRRNAEALQRELLAAGFARAELGFGGRGREDGARAAEAGADLTDKAATPAARPAVVAGRLDIRL